MPNTSTLDVVDSSAVPTDAILRWEVLREPTRFHPGAVAYVVRMARPPELLSLDLAAQRRLVDYVVSTVRHKAPRLRPNRLWHGDHLAAAVVADWFGDERATNLWRAAGAPEAVHAVAWSPKSRLRDLSDSLYTPTKHLALECLDALGLISSGITLAAVEAGQADVARAMLSIVPPVGLFEACFVGVDYSDHRWRHQMVLLAVQHSADRTRLLDAWLTSPGFRQALVDGLDTTLGSVVATWAQTSPLPPSAWIDLLPATSLVSCPRAVDHLSDVLSEDSWRVFVELAANSHPATSCGEVLGLLAAAV